MLYLARRIVNTCRRHFAGKKSAGRELSRFIIGDSPLSCPTLLSRKKNAESDREPQLRRFARNKKKVSGKQREGDAWGNKGPRVEPWREHKRSCVSIRRVNSTCMYVFLYLSELVRVWKSINAKLGRKVEFPTDELPRKATSIGCACLFIKIPHIGSDRFVPVYLRWRISIHQCISETPAIVHVVSYKK